MKLSDYLNPEKQIHLTSFPYNFGFIYDFFKPDIYQALVERFNLWIQDGKPLGTIGDHQGLYYPALCATPALDSMLEWPQNVFVSQALQQYLCGFFSTHHQEYVNQYMILGAHQHNPPTETSWKHTDFNIVSFLPNKERHQGCLDLWQPTDCQYTNDTLNDQPDCVKVCRYVACIYYLNNDNWAVGDGGETGIYSAFSPDTPLFAKIAPRNNSLLFFEINPLSFHSAQEANKQRNSLIWWYHASPAYQFFKNQALVSYKRQNIDNNAFEYWSSPEKPRWPINNDPLFAKFERMYEK